MIKKFLKYIYLYILKVKFGNCIKRIKKNFVLKYDEMKKYKDIHKGKRCFIVATGPSLTVEDIEKLEEEFTFSMNSIILMFDKIKWRPTYYGIQDLESYKKLKDKLSEVNLNTVFYVDTINNFCRKNAIPFFLDLQKHLIGDYTTKFSKDCSKTVYDGYTITYSLIQIAIYMGFKEIYLLGCDTNYCGKLRHFIEYQEKSKGSENFAFYAIPAYKVANDYALDNGVQIFNVTRGGMLDIFPRKNLDEIIKNNR